MSRFLNRSERNRLAIAVARKSCLRLNVSKAVLTETQARLIWNTVCKVAADTAVAGRASSLLDPRQFTQFRRAVVRQTGQLLDCASGAVSLGDARALWILAQAISPAPPVRQNKASHGRPRAAAPAVAVLAALPLAACATLLGGNVKGSFSCSAPGGTCAPSTVIDDTALAMIQNARPMTPAARPWSQPPLRGDGKVVAAASGLAHRDRRVLKVVFPSFIDQRGYLHEARVVHAVADAGAWMQLDDPEKAISSRTASLPAQADSRKTDDVVETPALAGWTLDQTSGAVKANPLGTERNMPDPDMVAAARARGLARLPTLPSEIKAAVDARLGVKPTLPVAVETRTAPGLTKAAAKTDASAVTMKDGAAAHEVREDGEDAPPAANAAARFPGKVE